MKCPEQFIIVQNNLRKPVIDEDKYLGEWHMLLETQSFRECYKEECAAWDSKESRCRKIGG